MNGQGVLLAKGVPWPPSVEDFYLPGWLYPWITKFTVMVWIAVALIILFYVLAYRNPKLVPSRRQWLAESVYGFGRDGLAVDVIGPILRIVFDDEDGRLSPVGRMRHRVDHAAQREIVVRHVRAGRGHTGPRREGVVIRQPNQLDRRQIPVA